MSIRLLTLDDKELFHALRIRACREEPSAFLESAEEVERKTPKQVEKYFDNGWIAGAFAGDQLVAKAGLYRHRGKKLEHKGTVWGVYVAPEARGHGFAKRCIQLVLDEAKKAGIELVQLSTNAVNPVTIGLYLSLGFEVCGKERHIIKLENGRYIDDVLMVKFLS